MEAANLVAELEKRGFKCTVVPMEQRYRGQRFHYGISVNGRSHEDVSVSNIENTSIPKYWYNRAKWDFWYDNTDAAAFAETYRKASEAGHIAESKN